LRKDLNKWKTRTITIAPDEQPEELQGLKWDGDVLLVRTRHPGR